jgi:hypothetical protein
MPALLLRFAPHLGIGALLILAALGLALKLQTVRLDRTREALAMEQALHETDIANFRATQARASADWQAEIARTTARNRRLTDDADRQADADRASYLDRVLRLPATAAHSGAAGAAAMPGAGAPQGADGRGRDTVLLARSDALICAANTARLSAAHDWATAVLGEKQSAGPDRD